MTTKTDLDRLAASRQLVRQRFTVVQQALRKELGWAPTARTWVLPLIGLAGGLALAWKLTRRRT